MTLADIYEPFARISDKDSAVQGLRRVGRFITRRYVDQCTAMGDDIDILIDALKGVGLQDSGVGGMEVS